MSTLQDVRTGVGRAWEGLAEGWHHLQERASQALTRFTPGRAGELETAGEQRARQGARWGLLAAELEETDQAVVARMEVPGLSRDELEVFVDHGALVVRGEKRVRHDSHQGRYHLLERAYGRFERALPLPAAVDEEGARASYRDGVLEVTLPRATAPGARRIQVQGR